MNVKVIVYQQFVNTSNKELKADFYSEIFSLSIGSHTIVESRIRVHRIGERELTADREDNPKCFNVYWFRCRRLSQCDTRVCCAVELSRVGFPAPSDIGTRYASGVALKSDRYAFIHEINCCR